jgi:hypothetical protein
MSFIEYTLRASRNEDSNPRNQGLRTHDGYLKNKWDVCLSRFNGDPQPHYYGAIIQTSIPSHGWAGDNSGCCGFGCIGGRFVLPLRSEMGKRNYESRCGTRQGKTTEFEKTEVAAERTASRAMVASGNVRNKTA